MTNNQVLIVAACITAVPAFLTFTLGWMVRNQIENIHLSINSRFDQFLKLAQKASFAEGAKSETDKASTKRNTS
jgi:hypothetical protein